MAQEDKTIISNATIVHPEIFKYAPPEDASEVIVNFNTFDIKLKHKCSHKLSTGTFRLAQCPRCLGTGYYYDAKFNDVGKLIPAELSERLAQTLEKLALTEENKFHSEIAINIQKWLGNTAISEIKAAIQFDLLKSLMVMQELQKGTAGLPGEVQIGRVDNIIVDEDPDNPTRLFYTVHVTTVSGIGKELLGTIALNG